ncbi:MAG TPA: hypothetical protein DEA08_12840 [Planctomycetes bacterium]|nr:hypothetical protein [Planctomycetota bacterium]
MAIIPSVKPSRVAICAHPFAQHDPEPRRLLEATGAQLIDNPWGRRPRADELVAFLGEQKAQVVVAGSEPYEAALFAALPQLELVARTGIGLDAIDLAAAQAHGVAVCHTPDGPSDSAAELTIGLMISLARQIRAADADLRAGRWRRRIGWLLGARRIGVLGLGRIGQRVARALGALGAQVRATDIDPGVAPTARELGVELVSLDRLLAESEVLTLHVPLTPETRGLIDARALSALPPGALLINAARGAVVDEAALLAALESGRLGGAALDVFAEEPYRGPLAGREDVLLTCHMGSCTEEGRLAMERGAAEAVAAWLGGQPPAHRVV